ncbi:hypothetical protein PIB30_012952 [Stylosanthes scabra]|uniref:Uncharacterized protein n=1 Tax=Stylosanthes scabra TaxID=79078 RepID=A0ABU6Z3W6_9FABA|nr:hypothetical protein [Stylosanthes scabra]
MTSSPSSYLVVLNPEYHDPLLPPPPPIPPTIPSLTPPPPPVDLTTPAPPAQQDVGSTQEPSEPTVPELSHGSQPDPAIQSNAKKRIDPDGMRGKIQDDDKFIKAIIKSRASKKFSGMTEDDREWKEHFT